MGERAVELGQKEFEQIGEYVRSHIEEWLEDVRKKREFELLERIVRVEEEIKSLHALTTERFEAVEKRFEAIDKRFEEVDKRFEAVDKRFELMQAYMDKRFTSLQWTMGIGFTLIAALMGVFNFL